MPYKKVVWSWVLPSAIVSITLQNRMLLEAGGEARLCRCDRKVFLVAPGRSYVGPSMGLEYVVGPIHGF